MQKHPSSSPDSAGDGESTSRSDSANTQYSAAHSTKSKSGEVSKSQKKRDAAEITQLAQTISELPQNEFDALPLEASVKDAIAILRKISKFGARKRQLHYAGKLLRKHDPESVRAILELRKSTLNARDAKFHALENWRTRLIEEPGETAFAEFVEIFPGIDRQRLRQLIRKSRQEISENQAPRSARELFKLIRGTTEMNND